MNTYLVKFEDIELTVINNSSHEWILSTEQVAKGYGVTEDTILKHKQRRKDEIVENKHFVVGVDNLSRPLKNGQPNQTYWTKRGVVRLGFFIRSKQAVKFRDWAEDLVIEKSEEKPQTLVQMFAMQAQINLDFENRMSNVENKVDSIIEKQQNAEKELKALPIAQESLPELSLKDQIRQLVNRFAMATGTLQKEVWNDVYQKLFYNYHISLKRCKKLKNESWLDVAERKGYLEKMHIAISQLLRDNGIVA